MVRLAAAEVSFPKASALLEGLAGVQVETKQVERTAEALGREIEADERDVTEPGSCPAPTMYLGLDGTGVPDALLAKMDDDDLYGPEHLWDVALAREYSGAALVGKFPATVYPTRGDRTVRRRRVPGETWSSAITGGTMLIGRADLERAGGWRRAARHVDAALVEDVRRGGRGRLPHPRRRLPDGPARRRAYLGGRRRRVPGRGRGRACRLAPGPRRHRGCAAPGRARRGVGRCLTA